MDLAGGGGWEPWGVRQPWELISGDRRVSWFSKHMCVCTGGVGWGGVPACLPACQAQQRPGLGWESIGEGRDVPERLVWGKAHRVSASEVGSQGSLQAEASGRVLRRGRKESRGEGAVVQRGLASGGPGHSGATEGRLGCLAGGE